MKASSEQASSQCFVKAVCSKAVRNWNFVTETVNWQHQAQAHMEAHSCCILVVDDLDSVWIPEDIAARSCKGCIHPCSNVIADAAIHLTDMTMVHLKPQLTGSLASLPCIQVVDIFCRSCQLGMPCCRNHNALHELACMSAKDQ